MLDAQPKPRIWRLAYTSVRAHRRRTFLLKLPYGSVFGLMETLARAASVGQIRRIEIDIPRTISADERSRLMRWQEALATDATVEWAA